MLSFQLLIKLIIRKNYFFMWYHIHSYQKYKCVNNIAIQYPFKYRFMLIHMCRRSRSRDKKVSSNKKQDIGNHSPQHKEGAILVKDEPLDKVGGAILYYSILQCLVSVQQIMYHIICNSIITSAPRHEIGCSSFWCGCTASFTGTNMMSHTLFIEFGAHLGMICVFALSTFDSSSYISLNLKVWHMEQGLHLVFINWSIDGQMILLTHHMHKQCWMAKVLGRLALYRTFSTNHLLYIKTLVPIYIFRAITFFWWCRHFLREKMAFLPQTKKMLSWAVFREALIVAPPFLDMCLDIYGAWINKKKSFDWDIIWENIAFVSKNGFSKQKHFFVMDQTFTIKYFP